MKTIIVMIAMMVTSSAFAIDYQDRAEDLFDSMTATQAYASNQFTKRHWNRNLPGTSTWMGPSNICISGNTIKTVQPLEICTEWQVNLKESSFGKMYKSFSSQGRANDYAEESSNARGSAYCVSSYKNYYSHPINWQERGCVLWEVKRDDYGPKTFKSEARADRYADENSGAKGSPYCVQEGLISYSFNTTFKVDFFRKTAHDRFASDKKVGSHTYTYQSCANDDLTPVPAY